MRVEFFSGVHSLLLWFSSVHYKKKEEFHYRINYEFHYKCYLKAFRALERAGLVFTKNEKCHLTDEGIRIAFLLRESLPHRVSKHYGYNILHSVTMQTTSSVSAYALYDILETFQLGKAYFQFGDSLSHLRLNAFGREYLLGEKGILIFIVMEYFAKASLRGKLLLVSDLRNKGILTEFLFHKESTVRDIASQSLRFVE